MRYLKVLHSQDIACLREAAPAVAGAPCIWAFLNILRKMSFSANG